MEEGQVQHGLCGDRAVQTGRNSGTVTPTTRALSSGAAASSPQPLQHSQPLVMTGMAQEDKPKVTVTHQ